ncbi:FecCD family ABC transporter permease [Vibrio sp. 10N.222.48.F6]|uniref:Iron ABC transporter permease n=3 Tax=Vibrio TaxID=662 RepID=A0AB38NU73_9VIBR|nr:iron ABC transporter permease [Vibrio tasmaniensis]TKG34847.1 iron ABC transporter permease [Vibrio tasmaniensis]TKG40488.1 iron ABC transporter permease [Vibrio tasmaniensis]TKG48688.1 iron ABC transporter permease [Vibrio tasmaniensis]TKG49764.1 iron ABC transporter permease [Vibrio tasmaniensis]TKG55802.1 iron ABC transporter permease [Vibrio tasmaniensis]
MKNWHSASKKYMTSLSTNLNRTALNTCVFSSVFALLAMFSLSLGSVQLSFAQVATIFSAAMSQQIDSPIDQVVLHLRLPRTIIAIICGAGLGIVGALLQTVTKNDLADPFIFGLSSGAATGAVFVITVIGSAIGIWTLPLAAFIGGIISASAVLFLVRKVDGQASSQIVLAGLAISFLFTALTNFLVFHGDQRAAHSILFWSLGGLGNARWDNVLIVLAGLIALIVLGILKHRQLDCLLAGDDVAQTMGVDTKRLQSGVFIVCAFATACFVSIIGVVGFIGLMVPHIAKKIIGPLHKKLLITSGLIGALLMLLSDILARTLVAPQELPLGVVTTAFGALFIVSILMEKSNES